YGNLSLIYRPRKWTLEAALRYNGNKPLKDYAIRSTDASAFLRDGTSDNLELTERCEDGTYCIGTPAWTTLNLYGVYNCTEDVQLNIAVENIFDVHYRPFASGVSAAGRNVMLGVQVHF
ncbi:MAG: hypothetical protein AAF738_10575, partial [Bacteroidota bacterium]